MWFKSAGASCRPSYNLLVPRFTLVETGFWHTRGICRACPAVSVESACNTQAPIAKFKPSACPPSLLWFPYEDTPKGRGKVSGPNATSQYVWPRDPAFQALPLHVEVHSIEPLQDSQHSGPHLLLQQSAHVFEENEISSALLDHTAGFEKEDRTGASKSKP